MDSSIVDRLNEKTSGVITPSPLEGVVAERQSVILRSRKQANSKTNRDTHKLSFGSVPKKLQTSDEIMKTNLDLNSGDKKQTDKALAELKRQKA